MSYDLKLDDFKKIFDEAKMGIYLYTKESGVIYANKALISFLNATPENVLGFNFLKFIGKEEKAEVLKYANLAFAGETGDIPYPIQINLGTGAKRKTIKFYPEVRIVDDKKCIIGYTVDVTGIGEQGNKKVLLDSEINIVGILEEFNNLLTGILGYTSILKMKEQREENSKIIKKIYDITIEASKIVKSVVPQQGKALQKSKHFIIADEDSRSAAILRTILEKHEYSAIILNGDRVVQETMKNLNEIRGVFTDIYIPGVNAFGYITNILSKNNNLDVVLMAHERELREVQDILDVHDVYFLQKPIEEKNVLNLIKLMERS